MSTTPISLHLIVELSLAPHNHDHAITLVCHWSMYAYVTEGRINWCCRDQDLKSAEPRAKNELRTNKKQKNNQRKQRKVKNHRSFLTKLSKKTHKKLNIPNIFYKHLSCNYTIAMIYAIDKTKENSGEVLNTPPQDNHK